MLNVHLLAEMVYTCDMTKQHFFVSKSKVDAHTGLACTGIPENHFALIGMSVSLLTPWRNDTPLKFVKTCKQSLIS